MSKAYDNVLYHTRALARMAAPSIVKGERAAFFRRATGEDRGSFPSGSVSPRYSVLEKYFLDIPEFPLHSGGPFNLDAMAAMNGRRWTRAGAERAESIEGRSGERGRRGISFRKNPISKFF